MADTMQSSPAPYHSSSSISSPPVSPGHNDSDTLHLAAPKITAAQPAAASAGVSALKTATTQPATSSDKPKRPRKKKELGPDGKPIDDGKPKRQRKPAAPKTANGTTTTNPRKKLKTEQDDTRQAAITDMISSTTTPTAAVSIPKVNDAPANLSAPIATARAVTSGQRYDPVRGVSVDYARPSQPSTPSLTTTTPAVSQPINRASASPSIASLIDNPVTMNTSIRSPQPVVSQPFQPTPHRVPNGIAALPTHLSPSPAPKVVNGESDAMDIDPKPTQKTDKSSDAKAPSKASSAAQTPKAAAPKATGSGLLSSSDLFGGPSSTEGLLSKGVNIDIQIKLDPAGGNHINVAQEIIKKYGQDALYPRAAAHRERLLRVMAEANKLDGSADEGGEDVMSEGEGDSNVEMGGMNDTADGEKPRAKRQKKDDYDLDDEFIDDTELAWQQQAAVAKDGFFVYSGPLRTEADIAKAEANAGKGGRGRGGRRGKAASSTTHASFAEKKETPSATSTATTAPARGKGSRGGRTTGAPRKSRITKAEKEKMEAEKADREKQAANITTNGSAQLTNGAASANAVASSPGPVPSADHVLPMTATPAAIIDTTAT